MEPWEIMISESQERMVAVVRPQMLDAVRARVRALGAAVHRRSASVTEHGRAARVLRAARSSARFPARLLTDECPRYEVEQAKPDAWPASAEAAERREPRRQDVDLRAVRPARRLAHGPPPRASTPASCACGPSLRGLAVVAAGARGPGESRSVPRRRRRRCSARRATSRAPAASRSGSPTASTSATPRSRRSRYELAQAIEGIAQAAEALGIPVVSGNVSLYNDTDGRSIPPTPVVGCVGLVADVRLVPGALAARRRRAARARRPEDEPRGRGRARSGSSGRLRRCSRSATTSATAASRHALAEAATVERLRGGRRAARPSPTRGAALLAARPATSSRLGSQRLRRDRAGALDVRCLRHLRSWLRGCAARVLRALRAAAPRAGVGGDRRLRGRPADGAARPGLSRRFSTKTSCTACAAQVAIGHTRYSTTGSSQWSNAQPLVQHGAARTVALGHNGNLVNETALRDELRAAGVTAIREVGAQPQRRRRSAPSRSSAWLSATGSAACWRAGTCVP